MAPIKLVDRNILSSLLTRLYFAYRFSPTCEIDSRDGQVRCTACPPGYEGRRCERCARNYVGNPLVVGDYCRISDGM